MEFDDVLHEIEEKMDKAVQVYAEEVRGIRTGRAAPGLVESLRVEYYGSPTPLKQIASISVPEPRLLLIKAFDQASVKNIEKALLKSELGLTPNVDGRILRLQVPPLSEERRHQLANQVKDLGEKAKVAVRNIRREGNRQADKLLDDAVLNEDNAKKLKDEIQELTKKSEKRVDEIHEDKKKEILEI